MEEKSNKSKSNIIIAILLILVIGMTSYIAYDKGFNKAKENLNENKTENNENQKVENNENDNTINNTMSNEEAINLGKQLWNYAYGSYWGSENVWKTHTATNQYGGTSIICDTTQEEIKAKYTTDFKADSCLSDETSCTSYDIDSFIALDCNGAGRGAIQTYMETNLSIKTIEENEIIFIATSTYCNSSLCQEGKNVAKTINKEFIIKKVNNEWLISYFYLPN